MSPYEVSTRQFRFSHAIVQSDVDLVTCCATDEKMRLARCNTYLLMLQTSRSFAAISVHVVECTPVSNMLLSQRVSTVHGHITKYNNLIWSTWSKHTMMRSCHRRVPLPMELQPLPYVLTVSIFNRVVHFILPRSKPLEGLDAIIVMSLYMTTPRTSCCSIPLAEPASLDPLTLGLR